MHFSGKKPHKTVPFHAQFHGSWIRQSLSGVCATRICAELDKFPAGPELWPEEMLGYSSDLPWIKTQIGSCWRACCQNTHRINFCSLEDEMLWMTVNLPGCQILIQVGHFLIFLGRLEFFKRPNLKLLASASLHLLLMSREMALPGSGKVLCGSHVSRRMLGVLLGN